MKKRYYFVSAILAILAIFSTQFWNNANISTDYPQQDMEQLYNEVSSIISKTGQKPVAIVTGSTSGIGQELATELYRLGANVIIASRSEAKCAKIIKEIKDLGFNTTGHLEVGVLDTSDLDSVKTFVKTFQSKYKHLNYLVNNAGIHYMSTENTPLVNLSAPIISKQGYDLSFATNYLGHFLLTNSLLPMMNHGRIINIASTYHFQSDGSTLMPAITEDSIHDKPHSVTPSAGKVEPTFYHRRIAYGVSKLAQVLHVKELQRRLDSMTHAAHGSNDDTETATTSADDSAAESHHQHNTSLSTSSTATVASTTGATAVASLPATTPSSDITSEKRNVKAVVVCPGWVATNILPPGAVGTFVKNNAFKSRSSILAPMCAMFDPALQGGEFVVNSKIPHTLTQSEYASTIFKIMSFFGLRDIYTDIVAMVVLLQQSRTYGCHVQKSSEESNDAHLARSLYDWTLNELALKGY